MKEIKTHPLEDLEESWSLPKASPMKLTAWWLITSAN